jgi:hypothetical protein
LAKSFQLPLPSPTKIQDRPPERDTTPMSSGPSPFTSPRAICDFQIRPLGKPLSAAV